MALVLETSVEIGGLHIKNRLYRAPLLECAGGGPDAVEQLVHEFEPAAAAGAGLICQRAMPIAAGYDGISPRGREHRNYPAVPVSPLQLPNRRV